jgi:hypothetical protein
LASGGVSLILAIAATPASADGVTLNFYLAGPLDSLYGDPNSLIVEWSNHKPIDYPIDSSLPLQTNPGSTAYPAASFPKFAQLVDDAPSFGVPVQYNWDYGSGTVHGKYYSYPSGSIVPEPSTWTLLALGFAGMGLTAARYRRPSPT